MERTTSRINLVAASEAPEGGSYVQFKTEPYKHQLEEWLESRDLPVRALFWEMGLGKTATVIHTAAWLLEREKVDSMLVVAPNGVHENWAIDELPKHCPVDYRVAMYRSSGGKTRRWRREFDALLACETLAVLCVTYDAFVTDAGRAFCDEFLAWRGDTLVVLDECFPVGTLVDTPTGLREIQDIRPGDEVLNCVGASRVVSVHRRLMKRAVRVQIGRKHAVCSQHHPFFTARGWVLASKLKVGDECVTTREAMRLVRGEGSQEQKSEVLRKILLSEVAHAATRSEGEDFHGREKQEVSCCHTRNEEAVQASQTIVRSTQETNICSTKRETVSGTKRRQRNRAYRAPANIAASPWARLGARVGSTARRAKTWISNKLQGRYCSQERENSSRSRRSRTSEPQVPGSEKGPVSARPRVESVQVLELGRYGGPGEVFYDLEISPHPSYSVQGLLVHNSHRIKSPKALRTQKLLHFGRGLRYKRILTGTPVTNSPFDVFTQLAFLDPRFWKDRGFRDLWSFKTYFAQFRDGYAGSRRYKELVEYRNTDVLAKMVDEVGTRLTKKEVLDLPPQVYSTRYFDLSPAQRRTYDDLKAQYIAELDRETVTAALAIKRLIRLQQITCGFVPTDGGETIVFPANPRLKLIADLLENDVDGQALIFAKFTRDIDEVCALLGKEAGRYDGKASNEERKDVRQRFQAGTLRYLVGNPSVAGIGLTLTAASSVVYYSNSFNLEHRLQSEDRAHRIGQDKTVHYIDLVARGTVDERIVGSLQDKLNLAAEITGDELRRWLT